MWSTIIPVLDHYVRSGEWFLVAGELVGTELPDVESSVLVTWEADTNLANSLVIGATVNSASSVVPGFRSQAPRRLMR